MEALNSSDMGSHEVEKLVDFKNIFFGMALQDQVLVKWKYWNREEDMTWSPAKRSTTCEMTESILECVCWKLSTELVRRLEQSVRELRIERSGTAAATR
eukprot:4576734-Pleurochrysis_carterae.AAC.1